MANLIEQQNILRGLTDEALQGEAASPSGSAAPFMVLSEINRRKTIREQYDLANAKRPKTTVMEDLLKSAPQGSATPPAAMGAGAPGGSEDLGIDAVLASGGAPAIPAYASGGLVDLSQIAARYNSLLGGLETQRDNAFNMALLSAGAGMMGGKSSNFFANLGQGINAGMGTYQQQVEIADSRERQALEGLLNLGQFDERSAQWNEEMDLRRQQEARIATDADADRAAGTADMRNYDFFKSLTPEEQAQWLQVNRSSSGGASDIPRAQAAFAGLFEDVLKRKMETSKIELLEAETAEEKAAVEARLKQEAETEAQDLFKRLYPSFADLGIYPGASASPGTSAVTTPIDTSDPLGLGL